jgi:hypothetical protein
MGPGDGVPRTEAKGRKADKPASGATPNGGGECRRETLGWEGPLVRVGRPG